jgi:hypothetical protein
MNCCEEVGPLKSVAAFGVGFFKENRTLVMVVANILVILSFMLSIVAMIGGSTDTDEDSNTLKDGAWTVAKLDGGLGTVYYGTKMLKYKNSYTKWENCKGSSWCSDCEAAGNTALNCSVLLFLLTISLFISTVSRSRPLWDMVLHKIAAIVTCALGLFIMIIGMGSWNDQCARHIVDDVKGDVSLGPGLNSMVAAFFFVLVTLVIHILVPVESSSQTDTDGNFKPHDPEENQA